MSGLLQQPFAEENNPDVFYRDFSSELTNSSMLLRIFGVKQLRGVICSYTACGYFNVLGHLNCQRWPRALSYLG